MSEPSPLRARGPDARLRRARRHPRPRRSTIPEGGFTAIVGPNACGKSTLLRALVRMLKPRAGHGAARRRDDRARCRPSRSPGGSACSPQSSTAPDGITVADLVARGRHPHQRLLRPVVAARTSAPCARRCAQTRTSTCPTGPVDELSGGQRQRVWLAMALAQETPLLLLDEPTTFLDIAHQMEVLDLCAELHERGRTLVAVLHDLNHACRYATHLIAMRDGAIVAAGRPAQDRRRRRWSRRLRAAAARSSPCPETGRADGGARRAARAADARRRRRVAALRGAAERQSRGILARSQ